jgi:hypothetical protein
MKGIGQPGKYWKTLNKSGKHWKTGTHRKTLKNANKQTH